MNTLVALDLSGGVRFVDALRRVWAKGDAALPVDQRLPPASRAALMAAMEVGAVVDHTGSETRLGTGVAVESGDALVVATSGSTGSPKGVVLTHDAVVASAMATSQRLAVTADDHWLACLPLAHVGGLAVVTRALVTGTRLTVHPRFDPDAAETSGATLVSLVATALGRVDPTRFRVIVLGGSHPPERLPSNVVVTYGLTETGSGAVYDGLPLQGVDVHIAFDGEIRLRGPMLLRAYRDGTDPFVDGWFPTGDLGHWDASHRLVVDGRRSDLIITGGENVWPEPVETAIGAMADVADVAVVGLPDPQWGQAVTAFVVVARGCDPPSLDAVRQAVKSALPAHCAPKALHVVAVIPRTALGKIRRDGVGRIR